MAAATGSGSHLNTRSSSASMAFLLLFIVTSDRMLVPARAQHDCPASEDQICVCELDGDAYIIVCGDRNLKIEISEFPALKVSNRQNGTIFRSLSFYPVVLTKIQMSAFRGLQVNELYLNDLNIKSIDPLAFVGTGSALKQLVLDDNSIYSLPVGIFDPLGALQSLSLSRNNLSALQLGTFGSSLSSSLRWLSISNNALVSIPGSLFANLTSLIGLWLNGNELKTVDASTLDGLSNLIWLDLSENSIASVNPTAFAGNAILERLRLQGNKLIQLEPEVFSFSALVAGPQYPLELLDVSYNSLSSMPTGDLQRLSPTQLNYLGVLGNLWDCSYQLVKFARDYSAVNGVIELICSTPLDAYSMKAACYTPLNGTSTLPDLPDFCDDTTDDTTTGTTPSTTTAVGGGPNIGLIAGSVVGALVVIGVTAGLLAFYFLRKRRAARDKGSSDFFGGGGDDEGTDSTINLMYRLGGSRKYAGNPLFDTNVVTMKATAAAKGGGGAGEATDNPSGSTADGSQSVGEDDVSVAAKSGLKVVLNTNVVAQNFTSVA